MTLYHISPGTGRPNICRADPEKGHGCPLREDDGTQAPHFHTKDEAKVFYEKKLKDKHGSFSTVAKQSKITVATKDSSKVLRQGVKMSDKDAALRDSLKNLTQELITVRAESGVYPLNNGNIEMAKKRLNEAIDFADSRGNTNLMQKLAKADVLPSGAFKTADGSKFTTDDMIDNRIAIKHVEEGREKLVNALTAIASDKTVRAGAYKAENDAGKYTVTIKDGAFDQSGFDNLPEDIRQQISSPKESLDINLVRAKIGDEKKAQILSNTQTIDYVIGKPHDVGQDNVIADTSFTKLSVDNQKKFEEGVYAVANFYENSQNAFGKQRDLKAKSTDMTNDMKAAVSNNKNNTFAPGRARANGAVISYRENLSPKKAQEILSAAELKSVTVTKFTPDIDKARAVLSPKIFDKIFNARKVELRVLETKN